MDRVSAVSFIVPNKIALLGKCHCKYLADVRFKEQTNLKVAARRSQTFVVSASRGSWPICRISTSIRLQPGLKKGLAQLESASLIGLTRPLLLEELVSGQ